jgi:predicted AlkP superfamily pyrophosphatase or phosphodiesterase
MRKILLGAAIAALCAAPALANPVLLISIDGLRPLDIIQAQQRGLKVPNFSAFLADGTYATGVRNVLPTVTYPDHTTLLTGVWPDVHGIGNNVKFDPLGKNFEGWYWYASDIKVPTLWDVVHANHQIVASIDWPVSVDTPSIDYDVPEYWRAFQPDDLKVIHALTTRGLPESLQKATGMPMAAMFAETPASDTARGKFAQALFTQVHPQFMTLHLVSVDGNQHEFGPDTPEAHTAIETDDAAVGALIATARQVEPDLVVAIVSDHGFAAVQHDVNLMVPFIQAGLVTVDPATHKITDWKAEPWDAGGSEAIVLKNPNDAAVKKQVADLLHKLAADPANGIAQVIDKSAIEKKGGAVEASFWVDFKLGYEGGHQVVSAMVSAGSIKGNHGYFPDHPEMRATFMIEGPGIPKGKSLGEIDMRAIAPTLAKIMGVSLPDAKQKPLL